MDKTLRFSNETLVRLEALRERVWHSGASIDDVLKDLIDDRFEVSDTTANYVRRTISWEQYHDRMSMYALSKDVFISGYNQGWLDFQTRHHHFEYQSFTIMPPEEIKEESEKNKLCKKLLQWCADNFENESSNDYEDGKNALIGELTEILKKEIEK